MELTSRLKRSQQNPAKTVLDFNKLAACPTTAKASSKTQDRRGAPVQANSPLKNFLLESKDFLKNVKLMMANSKRSPSKNSLVGLETKHLLSMPLSRDSHPAADLYTRENSRGKRLLSPDNAKKSSVDSFRKTLTEEAAALKTMQFIRTANQKSRNTYRLPLSRASVDSQPGKETPGQPLSLLKSSDLSKTEGKNLLTH